MCYLVQISILGINVLCSTVFCDLWSVLSGVDISFYLVSTSEPKYTPATHAPVVEHRLHHRAIHRRSSYYIRANFVNPRYFAD